MATQEPPKKPTTVDTIIAMSAKPDTYTNNELGAVSSSVGARIISKSIQLNDCPVEKKDEWGPAISDMTISVNGKDMPVIRFENYLNMTQDVHVKNILLFTGNENPHATKLIPTSLETYLVDRNLLNPNKNEHAVVSTQACFVPYSDEAQFLDVKFFNPYNFHYSNPKVLVIVATPNGTSAQVVVANEQILRFNNFGRKFQFINIFGSSKDATFKIDHNMNRWTIIQVPLRVSKTKANSLPAHILTQNESNKDDNSSTWTNILSLTSLWSSGENENTPNGNGTDGGTKTKDGKANPQFIRYTPGLFPQCKCGKDLVQLVAQFCYGVNEESVTVSCDTCSESFSGNDIMWHCPAHKNKVHPDGFDVCNRCALKQLNFETLLEGTGYEIVREANLPIRVTYQYYFPISKTNPGKISNQLATAILGKLMTITSRSTNLTPKTGTNTFQPPALNNDQLAKIQQMQQLRQSGHQHRQSFQQPLQQLNQSTPTKTTTALTLTPIQVAESKSQQQQQLQDNPFRSGFFQSPGGSQGSGSGAASGSTAISGAGTGGINTVMGNGGIIRDEYEILRRSLNTINFGARNNVDYLKTFMANQVTDNDLELLTENDLGMLFPKLGPRMRFRRWLEDYRKEKCKETVMKQLYGRNDNGIIDDEKLDSNGEKFSTIVSIFKKLGINNWQVYMKNFLDNQVTDLMLPDIAERDIAALIPNISAKMAFRKYLLQSRQSKRYF